MAKTPERILIIKPSALGDIMLALPGLCSLAKSFPNARISWFVRPEYAPLIENHKYVDEIIYFDREVLGKWWYNFRAFGQLCSLIKTLRQDRFDVVFDFQGLFRSGLFGWLSGCKRRIGMANGREFAQVFYTDHIRPDSDSVHLVDYFLKMTRAAGAEKNEIEFGLEPSESAQAQVNKLLDEYKVDRQNYVVLVPSSAVDEKCWPVEKFAVLADKIAEKYNCDIIATGTAAERPITEKLKSLTKTNIIDLAGVTNIIQLIALLAGAKMVVSNDTGPAHIAGGLGVAMVLIFGHTNPGRVAPYGRDETVAAAEPEKRGRQVESTNQAHNIANVSVECVFDKVCEQLKYTDHN